MDYLHDFIQKFYLYLAGKENDNTNIIRIQTRKLEEGADLSFPLKITNWRSLIGKNVSSNEDATILDFSHEGNDLNELIKESESWILHLDKCEIIKENVLVRLEKVSTYQTTLKHIDDNYGFIPYCTKLKFTVKCDNNSDTNLSQLRLRLLLHVTRILISSCGGSIIEDETASDFNINFTLKSTNTVKGTLCGSVLNNEGIKDVTTTADDFYKQRALDMRLMAEHKYGLRITSQPGWSDFFRKLGNAAVTIELLRNKPSNTLTIDVNNQLLASRKGAAFILYNCARLARLFKEFDRKVSRNIYPNCPSFERIDFSLLTQPEEWELLYIHILQFPSVIRNCMKDITRGKIYPNLIISALSSMCLCFSVYYRRVKILIEAREHVFATMHARIYLLKAVERILHNGLRLLDIEPVKQM